MITDKPRTRTFTQLTTSSSPTSRRVGVAAQEQLLKESVVQMEDEESPAAASEPSCAARLCCDGVSLTHSTRAAASIRAITELSEAAT